MTRLSYLFDEHIDRALATALRRRDPELRVWRIGDPGAPALGTPDPDLLTWCEANAFVLVTNNRRTMAIHLANHLRIGRHVLGIFMLNPGLGIGETIDELLDVADISLEEEHRDQIRYLPLV